MRYLLLLKWLTTRSSTGSTPSSTRGDGAIESNTSLTGKVTALKNNPGLLVMMCSIHLFSPNSILIIRIVQHQDVEAAPIIAPSGRQEPPVEEGVLSWRHNHLRHLSAHRHQTSTFCQLIHSPQHSDSLHLYSLINAPHIFHHILHSFVWSCHSHVNRLLSCYSPVYLPATKDPVFCRLLPAHRVYLPVLLLHLPKRHSYYIPKFDFIFL